MAQSVEPEIEPLKSENKNIQDKFICVKKEIWSKSELNQRQKMGLKTEVVYLEEPISVLGEDENKGKLIKHEVQLEQSISLPGNAPILSQMDISQILNNSDYDDTFSNEDDSRVQEHETDGSDSSFDEDESDKETEGQNYLETSMYVDKSAKEDTQHPGYGSDRSTESQASNNWYRTRFIKTKPDLQYPASVLDNPSTDVSKYIDNYLDNELFDTIVLNTNLTALHKNGKPLDFTRQECKIFFGIIITMACINYPNIRMYWNRKWAIDLIARSMSRDRFMQVRPFLKFVFDDNVTEEVRASDQLWKIRPIINRVLEGCHRQKRHQELSINEMIIPLKGKYPIKQYCPDNPNSAGIKILVLANPNGLICDFVTYQGENNSAEEMVLHLTRTLVPGHIIYFNRNFTTIRLAEELNRNGIKCVGELMKSRLPKDAKSELQGDKDLARRGWGSYDVLVSSDGEMAITKWFDNKPVFFLSTIYAAETAGQCMRYSRKRGRIQVPRPEVAKAYESNMGAVGRTEKLLAECPSKLKTNKWTLRFVLHFFDLAISNSWIQYKNDMQSQKKTNHKIYNLWVFKRLIGEYLIESSVDSEIVQYNETGEYNDTVNKRGRAPIVPIPSKVMRTRGNQHLPQMVAVNRCRRDGCVKRTRVNCIACNVNLCLTRNRNCFKEFHTDMS